MSSLSSPLLHQGSETADVAAMDPSKPGQCFPITDEAVDLYFSKASAPQFSAVAFHADGDDTAVAPHMAQELGDEYGTISEPKCRLVWDGSGFLPRNTEFGLGFWEKDCCMLSSNPKDELRRFRCSLFWLGLDQSTVLRMVVSWAVAFLLTIAIPIGYLVIVDTEASSVHQGHPFDNVVQTSEATLAAVSFGCLTYNLRKHGLRRFLFLDQISAEPLEVQSGYIEELNKAFRLLVLILVPAVATELVHQVWWFTCATVNFPFIGSSVATRTFLCIAVMLSWLYRTTVFLFPCILFRLMCYLQNLRFEGYIKMLESVSEVSVILKQYMLLRQQLNIISHRYRMFIVLSLVTITASQFMFLLMLTATSGSVSFFRAGNLAVCSVVQLIGFVICLHGAARITHRAQRIVSIVSQWHAISTCQYFEATKKDAQGSSMCWMDEANQLSGTECDNDFSSALNMYSVANGNDLAAFQMRQAFVSYVQHSSAGISIFGFMLDRIHLQMIFMIQLTLVLWVLGNNAGISS